MAASDARPLARKNVAYRVTFGIWDNDGDLVTGAAALDSEVSIDGGTFADCTNEATEIATSSGAYFLDLTAAEMNGDTVAVIVKTTTPNAKSTLLIFYPEEAGDIRVNLTQCNGVNVAAGAIPNAAAGASGGLLISGSNAGTTTLGALTVTGAVLYSSTFTATGAVAWNGGVTFTSATATGFVCSSTGGGGHGASFLGNGAGHGLLGTGGGSNGAGIRGAGTGSAPGI
ncbi:MAG: hypothetical protein ACREJC_21615, partial [Tepidisphaeraceae bacterium]